MTDKTAKKVLEMRALASEFRAKAEETELLPYIDLMRRSAAELEKLADELENRPQTAFARAS